MEILAGWKDILRPIRDGYRHLFPTPDTGPTPEERARQRELDRLKGFAYFDTVDQLEKWVEADTDPLQRANTPLLPRSRTQNGANELKASVLICHDYAGNYHDHEAVQSIGVDEESYSCEYLQFVDSFIYFSHKLVCVPPPTWINTLHRNGVRALGTLIVEPQTKDAERLLHHVVTTGDSTCDQGDGFYFPMARKLATIAGHVGFDGWLINIEKSFPKEQWDAVTLKLFLQHLRRYLGPERRLVWYDALTVSNRVEYQNELDSENLMFSEACGSILTNYAWTEEAALRSKELASKREIQLRNVFFGIDIWAQNTIKGRHYRVTYPRKDGGGTNTGVGVEKLAEIGLSAGIFAPAWTFEHFPGHGRAMERAVWDGVDLPDNMSCSCDPACQCHPPNHRSPVVRYAREFPAGSETFFYTDFNRSFGYHGDKAGYKLYGRKRIHSQVGSQSILPHIARKTSGNNQTENAVNALSTRLENLPQGTQLVADVESSIPHGDSTPEVYLRTLPLYKVNMVADGTLRFMVRAGYTPPTPGATAGLYFRFKNDTCLVSLPEGDVFQWFPSTEGPVLPDTGIQDDDRLIEIGIFLKAPQVHQQTLKFLEIKELRISPQIAAANVLSNFNIGNIRAEQRENGPDKHWRLCWDYQCDIGDVIKKAGGPYSEITGPFSHFGIEADGICAVAYALEWIPFPGLVEKLTGKGAMVIVIAVGFDGRRLAGSYAHLRI